MENSLKTAFVNLILACIYYFYPLLLKVQRALQPWVPDPWTRISITEIIGRGGLRTADMFFQRLAGK